MCQVVWTISGRYLMKRQMKKNTLKVASNKSQINWKSKQLKLSILTLNIFYLNILAFFSIAVKKRFGFFISLFIYFLFYYWWPNHDFVDFRSFTSNRIEQIYHFRYLSFFKKNWFDFYFFSIYSSFSFVKPPIQKLLKRMTIVNISRMVIDLKWPAPL